MAGELEAIFQQTNSKEANAIIHSSLNSNFNLQAFKNDVQKNAVFSIVSRLRDVFVSMMSGTGRSLCYQLPAVIYSPKVTVVFCPMMSRIRRNIEYLKQLNIISKKITTNMSLAKKRRIINDMCSSSSNVPLLYLTPDQAFNVEVKELLNHLVRERKLAFFVVDESYCECLWIYGPKREYDILGTFKVLYPHIPWIVITTAVNFIVFDFMKLKLCLKTSSYGFSRFYNSYLRLNIYYDVIYDDQLGNSYEHLKEFIDECVKKYQNKAQGLIYCKSRGMTEEISSILCQKGILVAPYHAGLDKSRLLVVKDGFLKGNIQVLTLTDYSRIGFEKQDVRFIVHWGLPPSILSYYSESCQAGWDGEPAHCRIYLTKQSTLYYSLQNQSLLDIALSEANSPKKLEIALLSLRMFRQVRQMIFFCASNLCKHNIIANYFEDVKPDCINACDNCLRKLTIQENITGFNIQNILGTNEQYMENENGLFNQKKVMPLNNANWTSKCYAHVENLEEKDYEENIVDSLNALSLSDTLEVTDEFKNDEPIDLTREYPYLLQAFNEYEPSTSFLTNENENVIEIEDEE